MVRTACAPNEVFHATLALLARIATLENFPARFRPPPGRDWFVNSMVVAGGITAGKLVLAIPAAFAFARCASAARPAPSRWSSAR